MGRFLGYSREAAARYSFLLAMPAIMASGLYKVAKVVTGGDAIAGGPTILATVIAFGVGIVVILWFLKIISTRSYAPFVWYRIAIGILVALGLVTGVLSALGTGAGA